MILFMIVQLSGFYIRKFCRIGSFYLYYYYDLGENALPVLGYVWN